MEFLQQLKACSSVPAGLVVHSSANLNYDVCLQLQHQIINQASSSIMEVVLLECCINITTCTQKFLDLANSLRQLVDADLFCKLFEKLNTMGQQVKQKLQDNKAAKLQKGKLFMIPTTNSSNPSRPVENSSTASTVDRSDLDNQHPPSINRDNASHALPPESKRKRTRKWIKRSRYRRLARNGNSTAPTNIVVNLSSHHLSEAEKSILSKGLKFCPTPHNVNTIELRADITQFTRRLRLKEYFQTTAESSDDDESADEDSFHQHPLLKRESHFTPPSGRDPALDAYIAAVETAILNVPAKTIYSNITREESAALRNLKGNTNIVIKEAKPTRVLPLSSWTPKIILLNVTDSLMTPSTTRQ